MDGSQELYRQLLWNRKHAYGKSATFKDWMQEYYRREDHEKALDPNVATSQCLLIPYVQFPTKAKSLPRWLVT